jgi:poly(3-hydroxyoctanoate) depolymerase
VSSPDAYRPEVRMLDVSGAAVRIALVTAPGPGTVEIPLLLLNGIATSLENWRPLAARLAATRTVVMVDAPGAGRSELPRRPLRMADLARVVVAVLDELGLAMVDVLGWSWGGALAQQLARQAPDRVRRLVLVATTPGVGGRPPALAPLLVLATPLYYALGHRVAAWTPALFGGASARGGADSPVLAQLLREPARPLGYAAQLWAYAGWSSLRWLHRIPQSTLVIGGGDDPLVPIHNARLLAGGIPRARLEERPGAGHLWLLEDAGDSAALIQDFLAAH